jgi:hypothetical protein
MIVPSERRQEWMRLSSTDGAWALPEGGDSGPEVWLLLKAWPLRTLPRLETAGNTSQYERPTSGVR